MKRRPQLLSCPLTARERETVNEMKSLAGIATDANLMRVALYRLAAYLEPRVDTKLFSVRVDDE